MSALEAAERLSAIAGSLPLRPAWVDQQRDVIGSNLSVEQASDRLLQQLCAADLRDACDGSLPRGLDRMHDIRIEGHHLLQLLQKVDIANPSAADADPADEEVQDGLGQDPSRRQGRQRAVMLKVVLTDGVQAICGIERWPIAALRQAIPGSKLVLGNRPLLRRGLLLLEPQHLEALCPLAQAGGAERSEASAPPASSAPSGHDAAPQRSMAPPGAQHAGLPGNVSHVEGKVQVIRCYVASAAPDAGRASLRLQLCDGEGLCEALLPPPVLQQVLGSGDLDTLLGRARLLHGFFRLSQQGQSFQIESFRLGPSREALEQQLDHLAAGGAERSEASAPPASSAPSGHDAAPQRSMAPPGAQHAGLPGNVSHVEGKVQVIRCYVASAAPDAGACCFAGPLVLPAGLHCNRQAELGCSTASFGSRSKARAFRSSPSVVGLRHRIWNINWIELRQLARTEMLLQANKQELRLLL
ncbi:rmi1 [Symbiodinium natans]|uniref:RecQ-mediated genome instability protein 1 n=1 Tax=Symbiodinium natans TaxID=878477 RepID=A0A812R2T5_9DINO|nr:rmi1 [Symbiodinium natans]